MPLKYLLRTPGQFVDYGKTSSAHNNNEGKAPPKDVADNENIKSEGHLRNEGMNELLFRISWPTKGKYTIYLTFALCK